VSQRAEPPLDDSGGRWGHRQRPESGRAERTHRATTLPRCAPYQGLEGIAAHAGGCPTPDREVSDTTLAHDRGVQQHLCARVGIWGSGAWISLARSSSVILTRLETATATPSRRGVEKDRVRHTARSIFLRRSRARLIFFVLLGFARPLNRVRSTGRRSVARTTPAE
jgi:hypothetical protein